ncbi:hypothetical protein CHU98_g11981 [Xylaria longipes]|nr:hypothetical protein CHU98_g11981 [Xylaria longipes]
MTSSDAAATYALRKGGSFGLYIRPCQGDYEVTGGIDAYVMGHRGTFRKQPPPPNFLKLCWWFWESVVTINERLIAYEDRRLGWRTRKRDDDELETSMADEAMAMMVSALDWFNARFISQATPLSRQLRRGAEWYCVSRKRPNYTTASITRSANSQLGLDAESTATAAYDRCLGLMSMPD